MGAGMVLDALAAEAEVALSPEAEAVRVLYRATTDPRQAIRTCASARELQAAGHEEDVEVALELNVSDVVPVMVNGAFSGLTDPT